MEVFDRTYKFARRLGRENPASQQAVCMKSPGQTTRNAGDMINKLTSRYNRQRRAQIPRK